MRLLTVTQSVCPTCAKIIPAKVVSEDDRVYMLKFCPDHGEDRAFIRTGVDDYVRTQSYVKPATVPMAFHGDSTADCPDGCGMCDRHEQHLCMPIIEITTRCNLSCPICINDSGAKGVAAWDMTASEFDAILDRLIAAEPQIDLLNISGGEPLMHPDILAIIDLATARKEIVRVSISSNGLRLLDEPGLVRELKARDVGVSLQFDGFSKEADVALRGTRLVDKKLEVFGALKDADVTCSLTMTAAVGINDDQFPELLKFLFANDNIVSLMVQPLAYTGRARGMAGRENRLTIPDITRLIGSAGVPFVSETDFVPLPCSHPLCFSLSFFLMLEDGSGVSLGRLADASTLLDMMSNRVIFGLKPDEQERLKRLIYELWSGPAGANPESKAVLATLRGILKEVSSIPTCCFDPRKAFTQMERKVKSIFIHAFQDADTFDLSRIRRCCQGYPQTDGRIVPVCVHNVYGGRGGL